MWWWASSLIRFPVVCMPRSFYFTHVLRADVLLLLRCQATFVIKTFYICLASSATSPVIFIRLKIMCPTTTGKMLELWLLKFSATFSLLLFLCGNCWSFIKNFQGKIEFNSCIKIIKQTKVKNSWETSVFGRKVPEIIESHLLVVF